MPKLEVVTVQRGVVYNFLQLITSYYNLLQLITTCYNFLQVYESGTNVYAGILLRKIIARVFCFVQQSDSLVAGWSDP